MRRLTIKKILLPLKGYLWLESSLATAGTRRILQTAYICGDRSVAIRLQVQANFLEPPTPEVEGTPILHVAPGGASKCQTNVSSIFGSSPNVA